MSFADFPGLSISKAEAVLVFDLDGTLLTVNSFPYWVRRMLWGRFPGLTFKESLTLRRQVAQVMLARKLLRRSHAATKERLQPLWRDALDKDPEHTALNAFTAFLLRQVRPNLQSVLEAVAHDRVDAVLATSAAEVYAQHAGWQLGFRHILCSEPGQPENSRERKRDRVLALLEKQGWAARPRIFFTDHEEDAPLMHACPLTLWFGEESEAAAHAGARREVVACRSASGVEIMRRCGLA